jgi:hypothetical protein
LAFKGLNKYTVFLETAMRLISYDVEICRVFRSEAAVGVHFLRGIFCVRFTTN